ncbi:DUF6586 family protein [Marinomonas sp. THO17]|uniref:DUF6586 family protein n=1 Tax=Marinomonas sp. THO17 TaxID=3149048 RepID=UPI00336BD6EE
MSLASSASITNQRLDAARRLIELAQSSDEAWLISSLENSAMFQLRSALNGLLQEVKLAYRLSGKLDIASLLREAQEKQSLVPVLIELNDLLQQASSWCSQLISLYQQQLDCHMNQAAVDRTNLIGVGSDDSASLNLYLSKLTDLVLRFREESSEY